MRKPSFRTIPFPDMRRSPRRDAERSAVRRFAQRKTIQLGAACACGRQRQRVRAYRQRPGQQMRATSGCGTGGSSSITRGKPISRGCAVCVDIAHTQTGPLQRLLQRERIGYSVSRAAWQRLSNGPLPGCTAEIKSPRRIRPQSPPPAPSARAYRPIQPVRGTRHGRRRSS